MVARVREMTGKEIAVMGYDFMNYHRASIDGGSGLSQVEEAIAYWKRGGLVTFCWGASGPQPFIDLWKLMVERIRDHHGLTTMIWVYNGNIPTGTRAMNGSTSSEKTPMRMWSADVSGLRIAGQALQPSQEHARTTDDRGAHGERHHPRSGHPLVLTLDELPSFQ